MDCVTTQIFGGNANPLYNGAGLKGHTGVDIKCGWGTPIYPERKIYVYKVLTVEHPANDGTGFTAVFGIDDHGNEWMYGHCDPIAVVGKMYDVGEIIGYEANHGQIYSGDTQITLAMQAAGDHRGHHRHVQLRMCQRVKVMDPNAQYLSGPNGAAYKDRDGMYYEVPDYKNGYNGCVDWSKGYLTGDALSASDRVAVLAAKDQASTDPQKNKMATILWKVVDLIKSFGQ